MLTIKVDTKQVERMLKGLSDAVKGTAIREAVNKAANKGNTEMKRRISREFNINQQTLAPQLEVRGAAKGYNTITAVIYPIAKFAGRRGRNVIEFMERKVTLAEARKRTKSGTLRDLRFEILRKRKTLIPGTFVTTYNRGTFVAQRIPGTTTPGRQRYAGTKHAEKLRGTQTIDVPQMFNTKRIAFSVKRKIEEELLPEEIQRAIQYALKRYGK
jgi:hypothetical protein